MTAFFAKDFIATAEGLIFAVVSPHIEQNKVLCFLRYVQTPNGWQKYKYPSVDASAFLQTHYPDYLHNSAHKAAQLHAVPLSKIITHYQPQLRLQQLLQTGANDAIEADLLALIALLQQQGLHIPQLGVTGSLLLGLQKFSSDIDLVCYGNDVLRDCRAAIADLLHSGQLQALSEKSWRDTYNLRPRALSFAEYLWHEQRKYTKVKLNGRNIDVSFIDKTAPLDTHRYIKRDALTLRCTITDDSKAFAYPAMFKTDHPQLRDIVSFTASYAGQAMRGERVEAAGVIEENQHGEPRLVLGSGREAAQEYIKVIHE